MTHTKLLPLSFVHSLLILIACTYFASCEVIPWSTF